VANAATADAAHFREAVAIAVDPLEDAGRLPLLRRAFAATMLVAYRNDLKPPSAHDRDAHELDTRIP
jgi:hypothetical protein